MKSFEGGPGQNSFRARDGRANVNREQLQSFLKDRSGNGNSSVVTQDNSSNDGPKIYGQQFGSSNRELGNGVKNYHTRRATGDEVRNFLNVPGNSTAGREGRGRLGDVSNTIGEAGAATGNGNTAGQSPSLGEPRNVFRSRDGNKRGDNDHPTNGTAGIADGKRKSFKLEDAPNTELQGLGKNGQKQFGTREGERGDKLGKHLGLSDGKGPEFRRDGSDQVGGDLKSLKDSHDGKDFDRDGRGRGEFRGNDRARGEFEHWSKTWKGKKGEGHDHRDWSGKWRDGDRFDIAHDIRRDWHRRYDHHDHDRIPFRGGWWGHDHHHGWGFWNDYCVRWQRPWFWWSWSTAPVLYDWCGFGWSTPYYWDYGPGEYIYCNNGIVYVNGVWYEPAPVFYQQTVRLVEQAPVLAQEAAAQVEWLPLGVFAVTPDGLKEPSVMVQLAVTKDGVIGGTAFDEKAGKSYNIQGTVDKNTQRAVWSYTDDKNNRIVLETSVNNLTQNESTGLVHYSANDMRVVQFVRLQEPDAKPAAQPAELPVPPQGK